MVKKNIVSFKHCYSKYALVQKGLTLGLGFLFFYLFGYEAIIFALACSYMFYIKRIYSIFREMKIDFGLIKLEH